MAAVMDPVRQRFSEVVADMSPRDRRLASGLVIFVVGSLLFGAWWLSSSILGDLQSRVTEREESLALLNVLASDNASAIEQVTSIEAELRKSAGQDLPSFIEKQAGKVGIAGNLQGVREKQVTTEGTLEEKTYSVEVSKITLEQLNGFLHAVETDGYPLRIRSMKTKTVTSAGVKSLTVTFEVSAFRLTDDAPAPAEEPAPAAAEENSP